MISASEKASARPVTPLFQVQPSGWPSISQSRIGLPCLAANCRACQRSVIHGISADTGACRVTISAAREGTSLRLDVRDTGPGFAATGSRRGEGIGLVNTRERLQQLYGQEQRIDCFDAVGGGACVVISIPFRPASQAARSA